MHQLPLVAFVIESLLVIFDQEAIERFRGHAT
jgi:hypothetical protein